MQPNILITVIATARDRELRRRTLTKRGRRWRSSTPPRPPRA